MQFQVGTNLPCIELLHHHGRTAQPPSRYGISLIPAGKNIPQKNEQLAPLGINLVSEFPENAISGKYSVQLSTSSIEESLKFWKEGIGLKVVGQEDENCYLNHRSISPTWNFNLTITSHSGKAEPMFLDDLGCSCVSFWVRDIEKTIEHLRSNNASFTGNKFDLIVNGKTVAAAFVRGPHGEMIELLEFS
ncbi:VOC family protein [Desulfovibrio sp. JC022]|uniref:VOC family protein n=1 Tax=Desulfovibrio sp. JC022 TaxID=2593642 RepID=UPI0013D18662|nr:VOC family protein [Desulfovibrio sp. JC022]NDV22201.1 VOC family protein [Desulfovibrio sp. JC022]